MKSQKTVIGALGLPLNHKGELLISLRHEPHRPQTHHKWQITGGGVNFGETIEQALIRELQEELGVTPTILYPHPIAKTNTYQFDGNGLHVVLLTYIVDIGRQTITPHTKEIADYTWIQPNQIDTFDCLPQVAQFVHAAAEIVKTHNLTHQLGR